MIDELKIIANKTIDVVTKKVKKYILSDFHKFGINVGLGADGSATKYIDKIAEDEAINYLKKSKVRVNILSEEIGFIDNKGKYTIVLDPIDGTRNAYRGIPFYSISLAVGKSKLSDVLYGIVKNIPTGDIFTAEKGNGAFLNGIRIGAPEIPNNEPLSSLALGKNHDNVTISLAKIDKVRSLGSSSLEMCLVAIGALDYYVIGKDYLRVIDIASSTLIVREAGGIVKNIYGEELDMIFDIHERSSVIAACCEDVIKKFVKKREDIKK